MTYLDNGPIRVDKEAMRATLQRLVPERTERIMGWISGAYYEKGKVESAAKILARILEKRFGAIPGVLRQRIFSADVTSIETWVERAVDAPDLQSVFESN